MEGVDGVVSRRLYEACHVNPVVSAMVSIVCQVLEWSGDGRVWFALCAGCFYCVWGSTTAFGNGLLGTLPDRLPDGFPHGFPHGISSLEAASSRLLALLLVDLALVGSLKWLVKRRRPSYGSLRQMGYVVDVDRYSFPSGHASRAMAVGLGLGRGGMMKWWGVLVGLSRVVCGRHWAGDVLGGWVVGLAVVSVVTYVLGL